MTLEVASALALGWALVTGSVALEAMRRLVFARLRRAPARPALTGARVLLLRPCAGRDPWLAQALGSLAEARHTCALACRIAVADEHDAAYPTALAAAAALAAAGLDARVVLTAPRGPNRKAGQLAAAIDAEEAPFDVVMVADGDVDLAGMDLDALVAPLVGPEPRGAVWAPPVEVAAPRTLGDRASAALLGGSLHAFPLLALLDRRGLVGKLFAVRRDALATTGGFGALVSHLGEDVELARRLRAAGHAVEAAGVVARSLSTGRTWAQAEARFGRWLQVIRAQRPGLLASYPLLFCATAPIVVLALGAAPAAPRTAAAAIAQALGLRLAVSLAAGAAAGRRTGLLRAAADAVLADALLAGAFVQALSSRRVMWRDVALRIDRGGQLRPLEEKGG